MFELTTVLKFSFTIFRLKTLKIYSQIFFPGELTIQLP